MGWKKKCKEMANKHGIYFSLPCCSRFAMAVARRTRAGSNQIKRGVFLWLCEEQFYLYNTSIFGNIGFFILFLKKGKNQRNLAPGVPKRSILTSKIERKNSMPGTQGQPLSRIWTRAASTWFWSPGLLATSPATSAPWWISLRASGQCGP